MTPSPPPRAGERGDPHRPSRPIPTSLAAEPLARTGRSTSALRASVCAPGGRRPPRAVVVAHDPQIREGWARSLEATGMEVTRCVGPTVSCCLLRGEDHCALLDEAGLALYHDAVLTDRFVERLAAARTTAMTVATRDRHRADGGHEPAMAHVIGSPTV